MAHNDVLAEGVETDMVTHHNMTVPRELLVSIIQPLIEEAEPKDALLINIQQRVLAFHTKVIPTLKFVFEEFFFYYSLVISMGQENRIE
jgi:hypothetical protein